MRSRLSPPVSCPRCHATKTKVRFTRYLELRQVIIRHRCCKACGARWRTTAEASTERFAGMEAPAA